MLSQLQLFINNSNLVVKSTYLNTLESTLFYFLDTFLLPYTPFNALENISLVSLF